ncbi:MAG: hypothetical protein SVM79_06895, partial [Chloroflexota bacterium]|nr:hypothetical protein [Chloroflexota bacterium]
MYRSGLFDFKSGCLLDWYSLQLVPTKWYGKPRQHPGRQPNQSGQVIRRRIIILARANRPRGQHG